MTCLGKNITVAFVVDKLNDMIILAAFIAQKTGSDLNFSLKLKHHIL